MAPRSPDEPNFDPASAAVGTAGVNAVNLADAVSASLKRRGETLAFAESCTGGRVSAIFAARPGVSRVFLGSVVAYADSVKISMLGVPPTLLKEVGAVSGPVASKMASGVRAALEAAWGVSVTGIAGPDGGSLEKPVGTVFFGIHGPGIEETERMHFSGKRTEIQQASAEFALRFLLRFLEV